MTRALIPPAVTKEVRALLPAWLACTATIVAGAASGDPRLLFAGALAYLLGPVALGAHVMGHEYSHRTIGTLLSLPVDRRRLFAVKAVVLALLVLALGATARATLLTTLSHPVTRLLSEPSIQAFPLLGGLFVAPGLALLCRSTLAAMVFTFALPGCLLIAGDAIGAAIHGADAAAADAFRRSFVQGSMLVFAAAGAVGAWGLFMRLEAIEGTGGHLHLWRWRRPARAEAAQAAARGRRAHPVWLLVWKELRLQQITFVVVGLYLLGWTALAILVWTGARPADDALGMMSPMYGGMLAVLIGALSSAEERHHGTHEWQMLLPMAASRQWLVKVSVMLGLVLLFAVGLPYFLAAIAPSARVWWVPRVWPVFAAGLVLLASVGLYTSSLCTSGVRALVFSLPVLTVGQMALSSLWRLTSILAGALPAPSSARPALPAGREVMYWLTIAVALAAVPLLLHYAYQNHRSSDRDLKRAALQVVRMAGWAAAGMLLLIVVERFAFAG